MIKMNQKIFDMIALSMWIICIAISVIAGLYIDTYFNLRIIAFIISIGGIYLNRSMIYDFVYSNNSSPSDF